MTLKEMIFALSSAKGVTGLDGALTVAEDLLSPLGEVATDNAGGITCTIGKGTRRVMLDAHIDEIGFVATAIEDGFIRVGKCGGIDARTVIGQRVTVHGKKDISGVVSSMPPHLKKESTDAPKIEELVIDCGLPVETVNDIVCTGDRISFDCEPAELLNGRITGKSLDNRVGVAAIIEAAKKIAQKNADITLILSLSAQEELGLRGARTATYALKPHEAIVVDVSFGDGAGLSDKECGKLGEGVMIGVSPILNKTMTDKMKSLAKEHNIPYQIEAMGGSTGTNADVVTINCEGVPTALLSIPLRNMHTCCEVVDIKDIESTVSLITAYICGGAV